MRSPTPDVHAVLERLEKLERQNRRLRRAGVLALAAVGLVVLMGQARPGSRVVEANKFVLRDTRGRVRAELKVDQDLWPCLNLYDTGGNERLSMQLTEKGIPVMWLSNAIGNSEVELGAFEDGPGLLVQSNEGGVNLWTAKGGGSGLVMYGPKGELRVSLVDSPGEADTPIFKPNAETTLVRHWKLRGPALALGDPQGYSTTLGVSGLETPRTGESHKTSAASLVMFDKDRTIIWRAP